MDWNPAGGSFAHLRQKETWTDIDGWTALREVETTWESVDAGPTVSRTLVRDPVTAWETQTQRVSDAWGREAKMSVYQQWIDFQGARKLKLTAETHRHWQDVGPDYLSLLLREETTDFIGLTDYVVSSAEYEYDQFTLTDRGARHGGGQHSGGPPVLDLQLHGQDGESVDALPVGGDSGLD